MRRYANFRFAVCLSALLVGLLAAGAAADQHESDPADEPIQLQELVVVGVGTRADGRSVADSPVPVDVVTEQEILETGHSEVGRIIQALIPSFNFSSSTISDGTDSVQPATLRGMGPDQVLVLVNGKRRHGSALIHVNTSVGRGTAGTDLNAIPVSAIKRIEVLRDGASAQYGSDAIAGVINIVLKDSYDGALHTSVGQTYEGDGTRYTARLNKGFQVGEDGVLHAAMEFSQRGRTNRAGLDGTIQYQSSATCKLGACRTTEEKNATGETLPVQLTRAQKSALQAIYDDNAVVLLEDPGNLEGNFDRRTFRTGDADLDQFSGAFNYTDPIAGIAAEVYAFGDYSRARNESGGFYRPSRPDYFDPRPRRNIAGSSHPHGFLPLFENTVSDFSVGAGIVREFENNLKADLAVVHGGNIFNFRIKDSHNASWVNCKLSDAPPAHCAEHGPEFFAGAVPTSADAGTLKLYLTTVNLDFSWPLRDALHVAWGVEYRLDQYRIRAGEAYSYEDYDGPGKGTGAGAIQVFPGFQPRNEVDESRNAFSLYADTEFYLSQAFLISPAVRYEHYSDFGSTVNGKVAAKLDLNGGFALRGSVSSGFRAPSMQQLYFNNISTQFRTEGNEQIPAEVGTFRNDSAIAKAVGIPALDAEKSITASVGFVYQPVPAFTLTTDFYHIDVKDRIIFSGQIPAFNDDGSPNEVLPASVRENFAREAVEKAQFFMNAADTRTQGVDVVAAWDVPLLSVGDLSLKLLATVSETEITRINLPAGLSDAFFPNQDRSIVEEWQPGYRVTLSGSYGLNGFSAALALHGLGPYTVLEGTGAEEKRQTYGARYLTDLRLGYRLGFGTLSIGANNLFDVLPEKNEIGQSRVGTIITPDGTTVVDSSGVFRYSRRSAPFGFNGGFYYLAFDVDF